MSNEDAKTTSTKLVERITKEGKFVTIIRYEGDRIIGASEKFIRGQFTEADALTYKGNTNV